MCGTSDLRIGADDFRVHVLDRTIHIARSEPDRADAVIETDPATLSAVIWNDRELDDAVRTGELRIEGDMESVARFVELFPLPEPEQPGADRIGPQ